jgi:hypothetical protein
MRTSEQPLAQVRIADLNLDEMTDEELMAFAEKLRGVYYKEPKSPSAPRPKKTPTLKTPDEFNEEDAL